MHGGSDRRKSGVGQFQTVKESHGICQFSNDCNVERRELPARSAFGHVNHPVGNSSSRTERSFNELHERVCLLCERALLTRKAYSFFKIAVVSLPSNQLHQLGGENVQWWGKRQRQNESFQQTLLPQQLSKLVCNPNPCLNFASCCEVDRIFEFAFIFPFPPSDSIPIHFHVLHLPAHDDSRCHAPLPVSNREKVQKRSSI